MATPVGNLTVDEAHTEFSELVDQIIAIDEKPQSGEFGAATSAPFLMKVQELAPLFAHMCQLCKWLNILMPKCLWQMSYFKHWSKQFLEPNLDSQSSCSFIVLTV